MDLNGLFRKGEEEEEDDEEEYISLTGSPVKLLLFCVFEKHYRRRRSLEAAVVNLIRLSQSVRQCNDETYNLFIMLSMSSKGTHKHLYIDWTAWIYSWIWVNHIYTCIHWLCAGCMLGVIRNLHSWVFLLLFL